MAEISAYGMLNLKGGATFSAEGFPSNPKNGQFAFDSGVFYIYATIGGTTTWYPLSNKKESHIHTQAVASAVWTVEHGMGSQDFGYFAYDENHSLMMANVANVTDSTFEIHFASAVAGTAVCFFETELFVPQLSADGVTVDTLTATTAIIGGVNIVELANGNQADLSTLMGDGAGSLNAGVADAKQYADTGLNGKADAGHDHSGVYLESETETSLEVVGNEIRYTNEAGTVQTADLSNYLDDTNLAKIISGTYDPTGKNLVFTRDDGSQFTIDSSMFFDDTNLVTSVAGKTGTVSLAKADVGLSNADNTSDADKPVSTATQSALDGKQATIANNGLSGDKIDGGTISNLAGANFADNAKAQFGDGNDLQIYHEGSDSVIKDAGTGHLRLLANDFRLRNAADTENLIYADQNAGVGLSYDHTTRLTTTSTGIDVTGTVTADGLTSSGNVEIGTTTISDANVDLFIADSVPMMLMEDTDVNVYSRIYQSGSGLYIDVDKGDDGASSIFALSIDDDRAMTVDDGGNVGIGNANPSKTLDVNGTIKADSQFQGDNSGTESAPAYAWDGDSNTGLFRAAPDTLGFSTGGSEAMRIDSSGNVGLGVTPESWSGMTALQIGSQFSLADGGSDDTYLGNNFYYDGSSWDYINTDTATQYSQQGGKHLFRVAPNSWNGTPGHASQTISWTTAMTIDNSGNVTKPNQPAFLARRSSGTQSSIGSGDTITLPTEVFDQNSNFSSNTFTAPVTGKYQFNVVVSVNSLDWDATFSRVQMVSSNRTYNFGITSQQSFDDADPDYHTFEGSMLIDMDANDTCYIRWNQHAGTAQADVFDSTYFSGYLVA